MRLWVASGDNEYMQLTWFSLLDYTDEELTNRNRHKPNVCIIFRIRDQEKTTNYFAKSFFSISFMLKGFLKKEVQSLSKKKILLLPLG